MGGIHMRSASRGSRVPSCRSTSLGRVIVCSNAYNILTTLHTEVLHTRTTNKVSKVPSCKSTLLDVRMLTFWLNSTSISYTLTNNLYIWKLEELSFKRRCDMTGMWVARLRGSRHVCRKPIVGSGHVGGKLGFSMSGAAIEPSRTPWLVRRRS
jgi:hypothetical protein